MIEPYFNSRPSARGDALRQISALHLPISIHAPPRGATQRRSAMTEKRNISIHAPPRGATVHNLWACVLVKISIHAPPRGATRSSRAPGDLPKFQFTPLREGRPDTPAPRPESRAISIHAPPRGATANRPIRFLVVVDISIHAPPRGATISVALRSSTSLFQFTPLREGRHVSEDGRIDNPIFQFTPLREGRPLSRR